ncbi:MAG TPA: ribokinase [Stellaceae bacterium]|nr:ribokinase [Stellaceae bacterium]
MILVFGSLNVDVLLPVPQLPRPGETVLGGEYRLLPGGRGANQALAARRAGADVTMAGAAGSDAFAEVALAPLGAAGVDTRLVRRTVAPTGCALILVGDAGENMIAVAPGANRAATAADVPDRLFGPQTTLLCQMEVPAAENWALLRRARSSGARTMLNLAPAAPVPPATFADIDILVANGGEAAALTADPAEVAHGLGEAFVVTRGADGAVGWLRDGGRLAVPALRVAPVDTTGAGDTFVGVLAAALDRRLDLTAALRRASTAAALACLAPGAQSAMPDAAAIDAEVNRLPAAS